MFSKKERGSNAEPAAQKVHISYPYKPFGFLAKVVRLVH
ncbi:Hypothetical protein Bdt_2729 [Bdellovibrio bacteriovorus str. Tiberius]|uniref:Uncharacterized protein n=1 Tax=Bdellovibrio bacteriovorus str. Tiberius TaxID=1069642 RepID=K7Z087_BDEBC|nr:Hypothetical protein Bdt_2729 [Bdellovibrio bacteriovorus str. Tiberius]